jgi:heme O synthase-like polyprenyltransferase
MVIYTILFIVVASILTILDYTGLTYLISVLILGFWWLNLTLEGFSTDDEKAWSMKTYRISLIVLTVLCVVIALDNLLP